MIRRFRKLPAMRVSKAAAYNLVTASENTALWDTVVFSQGGMVLSANTIIVPKSGWYTCDLQMGFDASGAGERLTRIRSSVFAGGVIAQQFLPPIPGANTTILNCGATVPLVAGETVYSTIYQDSGTTRSIDVGSYLSVVWQADP